MTSYKTIPGAIRHAARGAPMQRIIIAVVLALGAVALFSGADLFRVLTRPENSQIAEPAVLDYEAYAEGINTVMFNEQGEINYTLKATRQVQYRNDISELEAPFIRLYRNGESRWNIVAESGRISTSSDSESGIENIDLIGGVEIYQFDEFGNRTVFSTEFLAVNPEQESLSTDRPILMTSDKFEQTAVGMQANLAEDIIVFQRDVRGKYAVKVD